MYGDAQQINMFDVPAGEIMFINYVARKAEKQMIHSVNTHVHSYKKVQSITHVHSQASRCKHPAYAAPA
jgi:hypothetical protein